MTATLILGLAIPSPAADTEGTLAIVNGFPGHKVDVCLNGREFKSRLPDGRAVLKDVVGTGGKHLRFYRPDPRRCGGTLLAKQNFDVAPGDDLTIVVNNVAPGVVVFDNTGYGEIPPLGAPYATLAILGWRDAADLAVNVKYRYWAPNPENPITPALDPVLTAGNWAATVAAPDDNRQLRATLPESPDTVAVKRVLIVASHRYEWILVGSSPANARFVFLDRLVSQPSP